MYIYIHISAGPRPWLMLDRILLDMDIVVQKSILHKNCRVIQPFKILTWKFWRIGDGGRHTVKKASRNSNVDNGGANQTTCGSENFYSHVVWFCATVVNIGIWRIPTWLFLQCRKRDLDGGGDTFFTFLFFWNDELERGRNEDRRT
jgi:hypothetical protein